MVRYQTAPAPKALSKARAPLLAPEALGMDDASAFIGVSRSTLWALTKEGKLPFIKIAGRRLVRVEALRQFLKDREAPMKS